MRTQLFISVFIFLTFSSCDNLPKEDKEKQETPKALKDEGSSSEISSIRVNEDMVESLYSELADKTPELKDLEQNIESVSKSKKDSIESYKKYAEKNKEYFSSTKRNIEKISDSVLRDKIKMIISNSLARYNSKILKHEDLLKSIDLKTITVEDLHTYLKIVLTLPVMDNYQTDNIPKTKSLEGLSKHLDQTINQIDTLLKKY
jgi:hypothetical protein